jgi:hypothetical protein
MVILPEGCDHLSSCSVTHVPKPGKICTCISLIRNSQDLTFWSYNGINSRDVPK